MEGLTTRPNESDSYNENLPANGHSNLPADCSLYTAGYNSVEWLWINDAKYDLRLLYMKCNEITK